MKRQVDLLETMTGNFILPRIALWQSQSHDALTVDDYLEMIGNHIVNDSNSGDPCIRNLQAAYMQIMKKLSSLNTKGEVSVSGTQTVIASAAYNQLLKTKKHLSSKIGKGKMSDHYRFLLSIVE